MDEFRFSPIENKTQLFNAIEYIHIETHRLCKQKLGYLLPVAGNIGVFCHYEDEFKLLTNLRKELTDLNDHWNKKYFRLYRPIIIPAKDNLPETMYTYLYVRKPDPNQPFVGDVDFYLTPEKYKIFKQSVRSGAFHDGVTILQRTDIDFVKLSDPAIDVTAFVGSYNLEEVATAKHSN